MSEILAWHFVANNCPTPPVGTTLYFYGDLKLCSKGLHASIRLIDALQYAPSSILCRVKCGGEIIQDPTKLVCTQRTILWKRDIQALLYEFSKRCVSDIIDLFDVPPIIKEYMKTGDQFLLNNAHTLLRQMFFKTSNNEKSVLSTCTKRIYTAPTIRALHAMQTAAKAIILAKPEYKFSDIMNKYNDQLEKIV